MSSTGLVVRSTTVLCSLVVIALCIATFYKIGWATYDSTTFPTEGTGYYGPYNGTDPDWAAKLQPYTLHYTWSPENFIWVAAGVSIVAAVLNMIVEAVRVFRSRGITKDNRQGLSVAMGITTIAWATAAFVASLVAAIYVNAKHNELANKCSFIEVPLQEYTCTRELMSCKWGPVYDKVHGFMPYQGYASACSGTVSVDLVYLVQKFCDQMLRKFTEIRPSRADSTCGALRRGGSWIWFTDAVGQEGAEQGC